MNARECLHKELYFGSGDFYLFCQDCSRSWRIEDQCSDNVGAASSLSGELRAALPEQPLAKEWRERAAYLKGYCDENRDKYPADHIADVYGTAVGLEDAAADLDSYHDEGRALLDKAADALENHGFFEQKLAEKIRKHLEGDSDVKD